VVGRNGADDGLVEALTSVGSLNQVSSFAAAVTELSQSEYDFVISDAGDFQALEHEAATRQEETILETVGEGVCIVKPDGELIWANAKMRSFPDVLKRQVCEQCKRIFKKDLDEDRPIDLRPRRFSLTTEGPLYLEVTATPVVNADKELSQVAAVVWDATNARRLQQKIDAIDKAGREICRLHSDTMDRMTMGERIAFLEERIIRYTRDLMNFDNFAVRLVDAETQKLELMLCSGLPEEAQCVDIYVSTEGNGISGYVAATGRSYICGNVKQDNRYLRGISNAESSLTVPIRLHDEIIGVFNVESVKPNFFSEDDRQFAEIFGRYVAMALHILNLLATERRTTTGQLADDVRSQIAAPLNDILTDATTLIEEYIGHDDLRHRLRAICDNVVAVKESLKQVETSAVQGLPASKKPEHKHPWLQDKSILVVDDEAAIRQTLTDVLTAGGGKIETARDGEEAIAMLDLRQYDLVLSDIRMPRRNGYEIFAAVKERHPDCPVILMTGFGYDPHHSIVRANKEGLAAVLFKPFKVDQLIAELQSALTPPC
jgi:CheY-like chemotaxis protein